MEAADLKKLRKELKLTQQQLAEKLGVDRRTIINYEKGKTIPKQVVKLIHFINSETDSQVKSVAIQDPTDEYIINSNGNKFIELPDGTFDITVKELPFVSYASYLETLEHGQIYEDFKTTTFNVDKYGLGHYMAFTVKGDSMNGGRIDDTPDGAKVLGRELNRHHWKDGFGETKYGWIILCRENIFHKDIIDLDNEGNIILHSRNKSPEYSDFKINLNHVNQIFKVIKRIF